MFGYPVTQNLAILNSYWEIIPESEATYIGDPPTRKRKNYRRYKKRRQFTSVEDFLNR